MRVEVDEKTESEGVMVFGVTVVEEDVDARCAVEEKGDVSFRESWSVCEDLCSGMELRWTRPGREDEWEEGDPVGCGA